MFFSIKIYTQLAIAGTSSFDTLSCVKLWKFFSPLMMDTKDKENEHLDL
jgi:hypothetical protein